MATRLQKYTAKPDDVLDDIFWNRIIADIDLRIAALEDAKSSVEDATNKLVQIGLTRINEVLVPALDGLKDVSTLSDILRATSVSSVSVGLGLITLIIDEAQRSKFAPPHYLSVVYAPDPSIWMVGTNQSWDKDTGELVVNVTSLSGAGTLDNWVVSVVGSTLEPTEPIGAENVSFDDSETSLGVGTIQAALEALKTLSDAKASIAALNSTDSALSALQSSLGALAFLSSITLDDNSVSTSKIQNSAVTADKIGSAAVTSAKLGSNAVTTAKINDGAITENKLGANVVTLAKLAAEVTNQLNGGLKSTQVFASSGTWNKPAGVTTLLIFCTAGGGGGGGSTSSNALYANYAGGGGAGGTSIEILDVSSISSVSVTVGAGGSGGGTTSNGSAGGNSSFGSYLSANGGGGGNKASDGSNGSGGSGGSATGGNINMAGAQAGRGYGANSFWGGAGAYQSGENGIAATGYGSGGGGPVANGNSRSGGAGKSGIVWVLEF